MSIEKGGASLRLTGATIVTMNDAFEVIEGDVLVRNGRIVAIGPLGEHHVDRTIDGPSCQQSSRPNLATRRAYPAFLSGCREYR